ncbi:MAG: fused MFS/spermidine synthase [Thermodesulfovibrio sp.]|nr:fused MFS/spermidine synthase [Thermodesulfovibrio sp.]MDW7997876.1 fused MFS/spermidine synthase [Thermodesulfovibrio sp.]
MDFTTPIKAVLSYLEVAMISLIGAYIITFIASFCTLVIEIVAGRILAPFVGVSLYTWTSIIGVILAGISIGAYLGGKVADRYPSKKTLALLMVLSGISALTIPPLTNLIAGYSFAVPLMWRILIVTTIIFFIPSCLLGMISPVVVKLAIQGLERVGGIVGKIYAFSTLGAIIGTFLAGFFLISFMGTRNIILSMGVILILSGLLVNPLFKTKKAIAGFLLIIFVPLIGIYDKAFKPVMKEDNYYYKESNYYTIKLYNTYKSEKDVELQTLVLDNLIHSYVNLDDPLYLEYEYLKVYADIMKWRYDRNSSFKTLSIGGGGYTFPRYMEEYYPNSEIDVVEIDPEVTKVAYEYLGISPDTRIKTFNTDGRWYVMGCKKKYDVIFIDAFNDLSVPYHLTTREFAQQLKKIMEPGGILLTNIVDNFQKGAFLPSYVKTLREVFGEKVFLLSISPDIEKIGISTFVVIAGDIDIENLKKFIEKNKNITTSIVPKNLLEKFINNKYAVLLTDDYAPVDNLIAPVFQERFDYKGVR